MTHQHSRSHLALSRRAMLRAGATAAGVAALTRLGHTAALAQSAPDYKALVCVFMAGGNDGHNMFVPQEQAAFADYRAIRRGLSLPDGNTKLLPVWTKTGTAYAFNDGLQALGPMWLQGKLAVAANVGMLVEPTTRAQYLARSVRLPTNLFSHSDQVIQMQAGNPFGSGGTGWAGRAADQVQALNGAATFPTAFSTNGPALFLTGGTIQSASLYPGFDLTLNGLSGWPASAAAAKVQALQSVLGFDSGMAMIQAANNVRKDALALNQMLKSTGTAPALTTVFPGTNIGQQLRQIAQIINLRGATGMRRQVFFASLGGFDTHSGQSYQQWDLLRQLGDALAAFYTATVEMGVANGVTAFTESDFGRTLEPSGTGSDHGWGSHHLVLGGAVKGGDVHGTFPRPALGGADDAGTRGVLIPTTSIDQYGATLARWFGVDAAGLAQIFPNLANFSAPDVGFMS